jgi:hypothetical protein
MKKTRRLHYTDKSVNTVIAAHFENHTKPKTHRKKDLQLVKADGRDSYYWALKG